MSKITYTIETKDFTNETHKEIYKGDNLLKALINFQQQYNNNEDVVLFIDDMQGYELDNMSNYNDSFNITNLQYVFQSNNTDELKRQLRESKRIQNVYLKHLEDERKENDKLKERIAQLEKQLNTRIS